MTLFHRARMAAEQLRQELFASEASNAIFSDIVIGTVADEDAANIDISLVHPSDTALGGADAVLLRNLRQVLVRNDVSSAERSFLIAHEFGHLKLHAEGHDGCHHVVETALNPESGDTFGAQKVEAYGARERAELQANIFARELLLPRKVARTLFLEGRSATQLAKELDLPLELVRQQLLDGLLLPEPGLVDEPPVEPITPTLEQSKAATSSAEVSLVVAGPGTGKTTTLLMRVQYLISQGVKPSELLLLTFSNRAARELVDRLEKLGVSDAHEIWVGTFHAFGLEFLRKHYHLFGLKPRFGVADKMAQIAVLEPHIYRLGLSVLNPLGDPLDWLNEVVKNIQRAKDELADASKFAATVEVSSAETSEEALSLQRDVAKLYLCYEEQMKNKGDLVDLGDLIMIPAIALDVDYAKFESSIGRFSHILVDEYQDVNRASAQLVKALAAHAKTLWVVGDARQAIYRFRGASMRNIVHFGADFPEYEAFALNENKRSVEEVVRVFEHTGREANPLQLLLPLENVESSRGASGVRPQHIVCASSDIVHGELAERIRSLNGLGVAYRDQVVLASNHETCGAAADALNHEGIPALHLGDIFQRAEIKDLLTLLQLFVDRSGSGLVRAAQLPGLEIPSADVEILLRLLQENHPSPLQWISHPPSALSEQGVEAVKQWELVFHSLSSVSSPWDVICTLLLDRTGILRRSLSGNTILDITCRIALWQFIYYLRVPEGGRPYQTVGSFITRLRRRLRLNDDRELRIPPPEADNLDAVAIMTIHGSKGLEFEAVHLVDIDAKHFEVQRNDSAMLPRALQESILTEAGFEAETEASNKLYVALSRAKQHLMLYERQDGARARCVQGIAKASRLVNKIHGSVVTRNRPVTQAKATEHAFAGPIDFAALLSYRICPRRYYYDHVLRLTPASGLPPSIAIEAAVMRELFAPHGEDSGSPPGEVDQALSNLAQDFADATPHLRLYADKLLAEGRGWLRAQRATMGKPIDLVCEGLQLRVLPHRITRADRTVKIEFVRTRPAGKLGRQKEALRWMLKHLAAKYPKYSINARIFVLSTGTIEDVYPDNPSYTSRRMAAAVGGLMAGNFTAVPSQWECPKCRHFLHCPA